MKGIERDQPDQPDEPEQTEDQADELPGQEPPNGEPDDDIPSRRFDAWRRRSAVGGVATGIALGLQEVFYPNKNEPVITAEAPGEPPDADDRLRVILDPDDPTKSIVLLPKPDRPATDA